MLKIAKEGIKTFNPQFSFAQTNEISTASFFFFFFFLAQQRKQLRLKLNLKLVLGYYKYKYPYQISVHGHLKNKGENNYKKMLNQCTAHHDLHFEALVRQKVNT